MALDDAASLLTLLWSPLVVVTAAADGDRGAQVAVSAFAASIVPERPRILVEIQKRNYTHGLIRMSGRFAVNLVPRERWWWVRHFGFRSQQEVDKLADVAWTAGSHGLPLLDEALGTLVCRVVNAMDGGDMTVFLAEVEEAERRRPDQPLHWHEVQQMLPADWAAEYGRKLARDVPDSAARMGQIDYAPYRPPSEPTQ
ncbi:MAG: flavin reductase family protein [Dehalococcoidia bacterium]